MQQLSSFDQFLKDSGRNCLHLMIDMVATGTEFQISNSGNFSKTIALFVTAIEFKKKKFCLNELIHGLSALALILQHLNRMLDEIEQKNPIEKIRISIAIVNLNYFLMALINFSANKSCLDKACLSQNFLYRIICIGDFRLFDFLCQLYQPELAKINYLGKTLMFHCLNTDFIFGRDILIKYAVDMNQRDNDDRNLLDYICLGMLPEIHLEFLRKHEACPQLSNLRGQLPEQLAFEHGLPEIGTEIQTWRLSSLFLVNFDKIITVQAELSQKLKLVENAKIIIKKHKKITKLLDVLKLRAQHLAEMLAIISSSPQKFNYIEYFFNEKTSLYPRLLECSIEEKLITQRIKKQLREIYLSFFIYDKSDRHPYPRLISEATGLAVPEQQHSLFGKFLELQKQIKSQLRYPSFARVVQQIIVKIYLNLNCNEFSDDRIPKSIEIDVASFDQIVTTFLSNNLGSDSEPSQQTHVDKNDSDSKLINKL